MKARSTSLAVAAAFSSILAFTSPVAAQETRAEAIRQEQAANMQRVQPPTRNGVERVLARLEDWGFLSSAPRGVYPWLGSIYPGGGIGAGAGLRQPVGDDGAFNVVGGYSAATYAKAQASLRLPTFWSRRAAVTLSGSYIDAPDVSYYGLGLDSQTADRTHFGYTPTTAAADVNIAAGRYLALGGGVAYEDVETSGGRTGLSIEQRFSPSNTPGLERSSASYIRSTARAAFDWRKRLGYSGRGGLYQLRFDDVHERDTGAYSFRSVEAEALQLVPILRANWVIAVRGLATVTDLGETKAVPYFMLPSVGGGSTVRGYPDFRFRDRNRLVMNGELRWTPSRIVDMALFYDAGKVTSRREELDVNDLKTSYGIGMRIVGFNGYAFRLEAARSREHNVRLIFSAGGAF